MQTFNTPSKVCNFVTIVWAASCIVLPEDGTTLRAPLAPFNKSPKVSKESARSVITFIGIPTPGGTDVGIGMAFITLTAVLTVVTIVLVVSAVASTVLKAPTTF